MWRGRNINPLVKKIAKKLSKSGFIEMLKVFFRLHFFYTKKDRKHRATFLETGQNVSLCEHLFDGESQSVCFFLELLIESAILENIERCMSRTKRHRIAR